MQDAGGGGGVGTSWATMSMPDMRRVIQSASTDSQWEIVGGWQKSAELLLEHKFQVEDFRKNLALAWPPARSAAAEAYLHRLDALIKNLDETYEAALANHDALSAATGSIYQAQLKMEDLYKEYESNQALLDQFAASQPQGGSPSPSPSGEEPPVAPGRQEQLRLQAIAMLSGVSTELAQAQARIVRPTRYEQVVQFDETKAIADGGYIPPPIPPLGMNFPDDGGSAGNSSRPSTTFPTSTANTTNPVVPTTTPQPGLILGGAPSSPPPAPPPALSPVTPNLPASNGPISPGLLPPSTNLMPGGGAPLPLAPGIGRSGQMPSEGLMMRPGAPLPDGMRAIAPGGIIGSTPATGVGNPVTGRSTGQRVNPVGGMIGEASRGGTGGVYGHGAGRPSGRNEPHSTRWDPDNPWETEEGVEPIVLPVREQRVDPGPAIGLH